MAKIFSSPSGDHQFQRGFEAIVIYKKTSYLIYVYM